MKAPRVRHPRLNCSAPGCKRGAKCYEPGTRFLCRACWRKAPIEWRQQWTRWRRRGNALDKRRDPRADICHRRANGIWERILRMLSHEPENDGSIPDMMREALRRDGLL